MCTIKTKTVSTLNRKVRIDFVEWIKLLFTCATGIFRPCQKSTELTLGLRRRGQSFGFLRTLGCQTMIQWWRRSPGGSIGWQALTLSSKMTTAKWKRKKSSNFFRLEQQYSEREYHSGPNPGLPFFLSSLQVMWCSVNVFVDLGQDYLEVKKGSTHFTFELLADCQLRHRWPLREPPGPDVCLQGAHRRRPTHHEHRGPAQNLRHRGQNVYLHALLVRSA